MSFMYGVGDEVIWGIGVLALAGFLSYCLVSWSGVSRLFTGHFTQNQTGEVPIMPALHPSQRHPFNSQCPICLRGQRYGLETNCGHSFCGTCIITYWHRQASSLQGITCPLCRQNITMLFSVFTPQEMAADNPHADARRDRILSELHHYNRLHSGQPRTFMQCIRDSPVLIRHLICDLLTPDGLMRIFNVQIVLCVFAGLVYLISPIDAIPEAMFGLVGLFDDLIVIVMLFLYVSTIYRHVMVTRATNSTVFPWDDSDSEN
ncbi:hypothetical protein B566_EDAN008297 [Ephemera danica]|nr:hypothetical protein B566_EDAN008297 [Ephemera danica]